jgi:hypothetical protein
MLAFGAIRAALFVFGVSEVSCGRSQANNCGLGGIVAEMATLTKEVNDAPGFTA